MQTLDFTPVPKRLIFSKFQTWLLSFSKKEGTELDLGGCQINGFVSFQGLLVKRLVEGDGIQKMTDSFVIKVDPFDSETIVSTTDFFQLNIVITIDEVDTCIASFEVEVRSIPIDSTDRVDINSFEFDLHTLSYSLSISALSAAQNAKDSEINSKESEVIAIQKAAEAKESEVIATQKAAEAKILGYQGTWNASTNIPMLTNVPDTSLLDGAYYQIISEGTQNITGQSVDFKFGDQVKKSGAKWERIPTPNPTIKEQNNPDVSFAIVDAQNKILAYFDLLGKLFADVNLSANNVTTLSIADSAVTKQKLEASLQSLLTLLSGTQAVSDMQGNGFFITDLANKKLLEISLDGKIKGLFDFSLSPIQSSDLSSNVTSLLHQTYQFDKEFQDYVYAITDNSSKILFGIKQDGSMSFPTYSQTVFSADFDEYVYVITDSEGKILFGIRQDGTTTAPTILAQSSVGLSELKQEVISRLQPATKQIVFWGDSLTAGAGGNGISTPSVMQTLMPDYTVVNCGVGGETVASISARQGGMPCLITTGFTLPANTSTVEISSNANHRFRNALGTIITPLLQGDGNSVNPCYVEGVECTLSWTGAAWNDPAGLYLIRRNVAGAARAIKPNSPLIFKGAKAFRDAGIVIIEIGQNGGYNSVDEYIKYVDSILKYSRKSNFIIVGQHTGTPTSRLELETRCQLEYGLRYINMREYISGNAMYDLGLTPTTQDLVAISNGTFPPSLWNSTTDSVHGNASFYTAKANKIYSRILELGYNS